MDTFERIVLALLVAFMVACAGSQAYIAGQRHGYKQGYEEGSWKAYADGWSDAHCGKGHSCESGQE
jgi:hypothetical protein